MMCWKIDPFPAALVVCYFVCTDDESLGTEGGKVAGWPLALVQQVKNVSPQSSTSSLQASESSWVSALIFMNFVVWTF